MIENKTSIHRDNFPGYLGHIPYRKEVIGMTIGSTNNYIKNMLTTEPQKEEIIQPIKYKDYSYYNKDYFNKNFSKDYFLEEDQIHSNQSKEAETWVGGSKFKIYPQHIPGYKSHVPGIYSSNIHGIGYSKSTAIAIKGEYNKSADLSDKERYKSINNLVYKSPINNGVREFTKSNSSLKIEDPSSFKLNPKTLYKSKIADVPTPGYSGHTSIFIKPISYLNKDKLDKDEQQETCEERDTINSISESFKNVLQPDTRAEKELPYITGYKGYRPHIKPQNYHGVNFRESSLSSRRK